MAPHSSVRRRPVVLAALVFGLIAAAIGLSVGSAAGQGAPLPYEDPSLPVNQRVNDLLSRMTLEEKVGQMTQTERLQVDANASPIRTWKLGSILSGGGSVPTPNAPEAWADMVDRFQAAAMRTRLHIPILYGIDTVHGDGNMLGATVFPHNIGLGATRDPALVRDVEHIAAEETRSSGPQWAFAPCVCVARDDRWGRTYESFGESPDLVKRMETAIDGLQGPPGHLGDNDRVLATAKHFAGDGDTQYGTGSGDYPIDQGIAVTSREDFWRDALSPYVPAVQDHDVGTVMPSFSSVDWTEDGTGNPINMHGNRELLTGVLKNGLGFKGFVISDWEGIHHLPGSWAKQVRTGANAGIDMFMEPNSYQDFIHTLLNEVNAGRVPMSRINDAVRRILRIKFEMGLFEHPFTDRTHIDEIGSPEHRAVARRAVSESQVLLKNRGDLLPLRTGRDVFVAGSNADNIGNQAGGWTLTWQGGSTNVIPGSTILQGVEAAAGGGDVTYSEDGSGPIPRSSVGVVVVGETPYAEGFGDVYGPRWAFDPGDNGVPRPVKNMQLSGADKMAVDRVCRAVDCVVIVVSGRPLVLDDQQLNRVDSLVAAWLPGSEGGGVADNLFGAEPYTGKLPVSWPRSLAQEPINIGDRGYDPLYRYGYGLTTD